MSDTTTNLRFEPEDRANDALDPALRPIAESLDRLARADRAEPSGTFEGRIAQSTHFALSASSRGSRANLQIALRVAAAVAVLIAGVAGVMMIRGGTTPQSNRVATNRPSPRLHVAGSLEYDDVYSIATAAFDAGASEDIDTLFTDASDLGSKIAKEFTPSEEPLEGSTM